MLYSNLDYAVTCFMENTGVRWCTKTWSSLAEQTSKRAPECIDEEKSEIELGEAEQLMSIASLHQIVLSTSWSPHNSQVSSDHLVPTLYPSGRTLEDTLEGVL